MQSFPKRPPPITPQAKKSGAAAPLASEGAAPSAPIYAADPPADQRTGRSGEKQNPFSTLPSGKPVHQIVLIPG